jgi:hypothetical protein
MLIEWSANSNRPATNRPQAGVGPDGNVGVDCPGIACWEIRCPLVPTG